MKPELLHRAIESLRSIGPLDKTPYIVVAKILPSKYCSNQALKLNFQASTSSRCLAVFPAKPMRSVCASGNI